MASNWIARTPSHPSTLQAGQNMGVGGGRTTVQARYLGDLVDVDAWGIVPCVSKIDTLGLFLSLLKEKFN
jgi:hypothetical protein